MIKIVSVILSVVLTTFGSAAVTEAVFISSFDKVAQASDDSDTDNPDQKVNRKVKESLDQQSEFPIKKKKKTSAVAKKFYKALLLKK